MGDWVSASPGNHRQLQQKGQQYQEGGLGFYRSVGRGGRGGRPPRFSCKPGRPPTSDCWKPTVPSWEKEFCYHAGPVPWKKVLETKALMPFYKNVATWDDSACEEAFHNAKARYWANINGLPCDIPLPDPDMYIDEIDWNAEPDPELVLDLEIRASCPPSDEEGKKSSFLTSGWDAFFVPREESAVNGWFHPADENPPVTSGWGDGNRNEWGGVEGHEHPQTACGWGDGENRENGGYSNGWEERIPEDATTWDKSYPQGKYGNSSRRWHKDRRPWGQWKNYAKNDSDCYYQSEPRRYGKKRDGNAGGWYGGQRHMNQRDNYQISNSNVPSYRRGRRRASQANERGPPYDNELAAPEP